MPLTQFDPPERFVAGTVGPPGGRTFFLQAAGAGVLVSVSLEKEQVSVLAERVNDIIDSYAPAAGSLEVAERLADNDPLDTPIEDEFRVTSIGLAWDGARERIVIDCSDDDLDLLGERVVEVEEGAQQVLRVVLDPAHAREFARRCSALVESGRPPCPFCGGPLDAEGHICPRANGYRR